MFKFSFQNGVNNESNKEEIVHRFAIKEEKSKTFWETENEGERGKVIKGFCEKYQSSILWKNNQSSILWKDNQSSITHKAWHIIKTQKHDIKARHKSMTQKYDTKVWHKIMTQKHDTKSWHKSMIYKQDTKACYKSMTQK